MADIKEIGGQQNNIATQTSQSPEAQKQIKMQKEKQLKAQQQARIARELQAKLSGIWAMDSKIRSGGGDMASRNILKSSIDSDVKALGLANDGNLINQLRTLAMA